VNPQPLTWVTSLFFFSHYFFKIFDRGIFVIFGTKGVDCNCFCSLAGILMIFSLGTLQIEC
jgi:hypothetical protein